MRAPPFETPITRLFGIDHPILCGGLMWLSDANYVSAVVNAGAMGFITPRSFASIDSFRTELERCKQLTKGRPFGVNLYISGQDAHNAQVEEWVEASLEHGVKYFATAGFSPALWLDRLKSSDCTVIHKCTTVRHALRAQRDGVDAVSLVGHECGGHPGKSTLSASVLGSLAARELSIPYVIGGGIGTGAQLSSALSLGASGVLIGSRMLVSKEIWAHDDYKRHLLTLDEKSTTTVLSTFGKTYRCLANDAAREVEKLEAEGIEDFDAYRMLVKGEEARHAYESGDWSRGILSLGPAIAFADRIEPAATIIRRLITEACDAREHLTGLTTTRAWAH